MTWLSHVYASHIRLIWSRSPCRPLSFLFIILSGHWCLRLKVLCLSQRLPGSDGHDRVKTTKEEWLSLPPLPVLDSLWCLYFLLSPKVTFALLSSRLQIVLRDRRSLGVLLFKPSFQLVDRKIKNLQKWLRTFSIPLNIR